MRIARRRTNQGECVKPLAHAASGRRWMAPKKRRVPTNAADGRITRTLAHAACVLDGRWAHSGAKAKASGCDIARMEGVGLENTCSQGVGLRKHTHTHTVTVTHPGASIFSFFLRNAVLFWCRNSKEGAYGLGAAPHGPWTTNQNFYTKRSLQICEYAPKIHS